MKIIRTTVNPPKPELMDFDVQGNIDSKFSNIRRVELPAESISLFRRIPKGVILLLQGHHLILKGRKLLTVSKGRKIIGLKKISFFKFHFN